MISKLILDKEKDPENMDVKFTKKLKKSDSFDDTTEEQRELLSIHYDF